MAAKIPPSNVNYTDTLQQNILSSFVIADIDDVEFLFIYLFYLYIYPPDSQESDGGAIHRVSNYPDLLPEMPRYCCPLAI